MLRWVSCDQVGTGNRKVDFVDLGRRRGGGIVIAWGVVELVG